MKKTLLVLVSLLTAAVSQAWEHPKNPDRFPSLGFSYSSVAEDGDYTVLGVSQDIEATGGSLILDTRLPLSNSFTLSIALGASATNVKGEENVSFNATETDTSGGIFIISGRYYFNR